MDDPIRYAVVGAGWIAQAAVLPAFAHARHARLVTIVSGDEVKRRELAARYRLRRTWDYEQYDECLASGEVDAVYVALPNSMHRDYTERAARAGVHVLCEKPMATNVEDCEAMIDAARDAGVKLMIAYRLHFEEANLGAIAVVESGVLGDLRFFTSTISQVTEQGARLDPRLGGGALFDTGIYCVNAARYLFRDEPAEVMALQSSVDERFPAGVDETTAALLAFPGGRLATFVCSLGAASTSQYRLVGTLGELALDPGYTFDEERVQRLTVRECVEVRRFPPADQFAPELDYFADCILRERDPEPSGEEGLADVRVLEAIERSARTFRPERLPPFERNARPTMEQLIKAGPPPRESLIRAQPAAR